MTIIPKGYVGCNVPICAAAYEFIDVQMPEASRVQAAIAKLRDMLYRCELKAWRVDPDGNLEKIEPQTWITPRCDGLIETDAVIFKVVDLERAFASVKPKSNAGRKPLIDIEQYRQAYQRECEKRGIPDRNNDDRDWRTQADVAAWISEMAAREGVKIDPDSGTAKRYARELKGQN